jgi:pyruvate/2-oxoglutarate dehydrogenase complex dihydrolipoamide dehydrogenase (E3) component
MSAERYDVAVIGAGQGGGPLAGALARAGRRTALIERRHVGGTCINDGCTPTKTMIASARRAYQTAGAREYGVRAEYGGVDLSTVRSRKQRVVESFRSGSERRLRESGVELLRGTASFIGPRRLRIEDMEGGMRVVEAEVVVINTGTRPRQPPIPGLTVTPFLDSSSILELDELPEHLLVIGGGYVGLEFAQMFRRFGSAVTVVQRGGQVLPREDADIAQAVTDLLREDGIEVLLESEPHHVRVLPSGQIQLALQGRSVRTLAGSHLLIATGRVPNTRDLNLPAAGVEVDERGFVRVDSRLASTADGVYALGDVKGGPAFTHVSYDDYRVLRSHLLHDGKATVDGRLVPYTVFLDPQLGRVGLTEADAVRAGYRVGIARLPMSSVARAIEVGETRGLMKAVVDLDRERILGCAVLGLEGGELMSMVQLAMLGDLPFSALRDGIFAHPTLAESLNNWFSAIEPATPYPSGGDRARPPLALPLTDTRITAARPGTPVM